MTWRPRFSLRTLAVFLLLVTSGVGLWWRWEPWYCGPVLKGHEYYVRSATFSPDGERVLTLPVQYANTKHSEKMARLIHGPNLDIVSLQAD